MRSIVLFAVLCTVGIIAMICTEFPKAQANVGSRITLRDASNSVMGYIDGGSGKVTVKDKNNKLLGYVDSSNTWSKSNRKIANSRLPGLLFCGRN